MATQTTAKTANLKLLHATVALQTAAVFLQSVTAGLMMTTLPYGHVLHSAGSYTLWVVTVVHVVVAVLAWRPGGGSPQAIWYAAGSGADHRSGLHRCLPPHGAARSPRRGAARRQRGLPLQDPALAAATSTATTAAATTGRGLLRAADPGHGQQLHRVGMTLGAVRRRGRLAHRALHVEGVVAGSATELVGRHALILRAVNVLSCHVVTAPSQTNPDRSVVVSAGRAQSQDRTGTGWSAPSRALRRRRPTAAPAATTRSAPASHTSWRGPPRRRARWRNAATGTRRAGPRAAGEARPRAAGNP